ncbi:hypothetical protein CANCADRAFT_22685, partial [Tortispora caseinolytica NRRL Y-17796]
YTERGDPLRSIFLPGSLHKRFLSISSNNTARGLETCGILCGKLSLNAFFVTHLVIPEQDNTPNSCQTKDEEGLFHFIDSNDLFILGWIHTHPTQTCFMSSVDLHTHNSYQLMLPESIAIVCAPQKTPNFGIFRLTDPPGIGVITECREPAMFHPHSTGNLYTSAYKPGHASFSDQVPLTIKDLRK